MHNGQLGALEVRTTGPKRNDRLVMFGKAEFSAQMLHKQSIQAKARQNPGRGRALSVVGVTFSDLAASISFRTSAAIL